MKLSTKLYLGFAVVLSFGLVQSIWSYTAIKQNVGKNFSLATHYAPLNVNASKLEVSVLNAGYANMRYFYTLTPENFAGVQKSLKEIDVNQKKVLAHIDGAAELKSLAMPDGRQLAALGKEIAANAAIYNQISMEIGELGVACQKAQTAYQNAIKDFSRHLQQQYDVVKKYRDQEIAATNALCEELHAAPLSVPGAKAAPAATPQKTAAPLEKTAAKPSEKPAPKPEAAAPAKPAAPVKAPEPAAPKAAPIKPSEPVKPAAPIKAPEPAAPKAAPVKPSEPVKPVAPVKPAEPVKPVAPVKPADRPIPPLTSPFGKGLFGNGKTGDAPLSLGERVHNVCQALIRRMERYHHFDTMMTRVAEIDAVVHAYRVERHPMQYYAANNLPTPQAQVKAKTQELESILNSLLDGTSKKDSRDTLSECIKAAHAIGVQGVAIVDAISGIVDKGAQRVASYRTVLNDSDALSKFMNDHILNDANTMIGDLKQLEGLSRNLLWMTLLQILVGVGCAYFITNGITANVTSICNELDVAANDITDAAGRLTQGAITLAQNVSEQGASVEESSASLEEISSMTAQTSTDAQDTAKNVDGTVNRIMQGTAEMSKMVAAMNEINDSATSIGNIIGTIENIAFQTNLLALNAAVEAARAGEMGKGFAVVAEEVRSLAQRSATAAHETADLITTTIDRIGNGVKISNEVEATFHTIESDTKKINELVSRISSAMKEESVGISQIKTAVNQLESIAEGNSEISEQTATTSGKMEEQSRALLGIVLRLKAIVTGESAAGVGRVPAATPRTLLE